MALVVSVLLAVVNGIHLYHVWTEHHTGNSALVSDDGGRCHGEMHRLHAASAGRSLGWSGDHGGALITTILDTCTILVYFNIVTAIFHLNA